MSRSLPKVSSQLRNRAWCDTTRFYRSRLPFPFNLRSEGQSQSLSTVKSPQDRNLDIPPRHTQALLCHTLPWDKSRREWLSHTTAPALKASSCLWRRRIGANVPPSVCPFSTRAVDGREVDWKTQKHALKKKFGDEKWAPRKRLSPDAMEGVRTLHAQDPEAHSTEMLAERFQVSPEAIRRILKGKWKPTEEEQTERQLRWVRRGERIWTGKAGEGMKPPRRWRDMGVNRASARTGSEVKSRASERQGGRTGLDIAFPKRPPASKGEDKTAGLGASLSQRIL